MATIADLARKDTRAGSNRSWRSETYGLERSIFHYSTRMLSYSLKEQGSPEWDGNLNTVYMSTGHGSRSDQDGMNQLFRELGMPLYFSRAGGATILPTDPNVVTGCRQTQTIYTTEGRLR